MKEEALKLADDIANGVENIDRLYLSAMICKLVEELKAKNNYLAQHCAMIDEQQKEIRNLEDAIKNALIYIDNHKNKKPLSDEEIEKLYEESYLPIGSQEWEFDCVVFARAIEKEHGIK